jgi:hypothetical protein
VPQMTLIDWRDKLEKEAKDIFLPESEKNKNAFSNSKCNTLMIL